MSNFVKRPPKKNVTVKVDPDLLDECRKKNINISKVCRHALKLAIEGKLIEQSKGSRSA